MSERVCVMPQTVVFEISHTHTATFNSSTTPLHIQTQEKTIKTKQVNAIRKKTLLQRFHLRKLQPHIIYKLEEGLNDRYICHLRTQTDEMTIKRLYLWTDKTFVEEFAFLNLYQTSGGHRGNSGNHGIHSSGSVNQIGQRVMAKIWETLFQMWISESHKWGMWI